MQTSQASTSFKCTECEDTTWVQTETGAMRRCSCFEKDKAIRMFKASGINPEQSEFTFTNYKVWNKASENIKSTAAAYFKNYDSIKNTRKNSLALLGEPGAGKTHITIATGLNLLNKKNVAVVYLAYRDVISKMKRNMIDEEYMSKEMSKYQMAEVLLIDDLLKGNVTKSDNSILFEIINYRYMNNKPIIVSSEYTVEELLSFDEAIGSRIYEMCKDYLVQVEKVRENNYRVREVC